MTSWRERAGQNPAMVAIVAEGFLSRLSFGVVKVALALFALEELHMNKAAIGVLITLNTIVAIALKPALGSAADRYGLKRVLVVAVSLRSVVTILYAFANAAWMLFVAVTVHGVSIAMRDPAISALIAETGGKKTIAQSFAWYQTAKSFAGKWGNAAAPVLLAATGSFKFVFLVAFALSVFPLYVVVRYVREVELEPEEEEDVAAAHAVVAREETVLAADFDKWLEAQDKKEKKKEGPKLTRAAVTAFVGLGFLISGTAYMLSPFFAIIATDNLGLSKVQLAGVMLVAAFVPLTGPVFGWLADHSGAKIVISLRSIGNICSSALYLLVPSFGGVMAGRVLDDMGKAAFKPAWGAMGAHLSSFDRKRRAQTMGYLSSGEDAGEIIGTLAAGAVLAGPGLTVLLIGRIVLAAITEVYTFVVMRTFLSFDKEEGVKLPRRRLRVPVPVVPVVAVTVLAAGTAVALQNNDDKATERQKKGVERRPATPTTGPCKDPIIRAIREKTGGC